MLFVRWLGLTHEVHDQLATTRQYYHSYERLGASLEMVNVELLKLEETSLSNVGGNLQPSNES